jgi:cold shock CspA family protein
MRGFVKRFDVKRGIGIITALGTGENLPVILSDILSKSSLAENDRVSFAVRETQGHRFAVNVGPGGLVSSEARQGIKVPRALQETR